MRSARQCAAMSMRGGAGVFPDRQSIRWKMVKGIGVICIMLAAAATLAEYIDYVGQKKYGAAGRQSPLTISGIYYFPAVMVQMLLNTQQKVQKRKRRKRQRGNPRRKQQKINRESGQQEGNGKRKQQKINHESGQREGNGKRKQQELSREGKQREGNGKRKRQEINHESGQREGNGKRKLQELSRESKQREESRGRGWREEQEAFRELYRISRELNRWRHDMLAEISVLYRMQKSGKYPEAEAYMEKLCIGLKDYPELPQPTGNEGLDAALMKMVFKCREKEIHFCYVVLRKPERMDSIIMGKLMDNLLCNSMEACQDLAGAREIDLVVEERADGLEICLENSIGESVLANNPNLVSSKREKVRHGFGMENIWRIVEEYGGTYEYWEEKQENDNRFCQRIHLRYR